MKKLITAVGTVALLAAAVLPAFGAGNSCTNGTTGPGSNNTCTINNSTLVTVNNVNDARVHNNVTLNVTTGGNSASNNTLGGNITTGNATLNSTVSTVANMNTNNITVGSTGGSNIGGNDVTGPFSRNEAFITNTQKLDIYNSNTADVTNDVEEIVATGFNRADNNTGPASIRTGNGVLNSGVLTHVNDSWNAFSLGFGGTGNNTVGSSTTGPFSYNAAVVNNIVDVDVNNVNDLQVDTDYFAGIYTGRNSASNNTLGGAILSGNALATIGVSTEGNINTTLIAAAMGGFGNNAENSVTGPGEGSKNVAFINNERTLVFDNWNNKCKSHNADSAFGSRVWAPIRGIWVYTMPCDENDLGVVNDIEAIVDAGNNAGNNNTGGGTIVAGGLATMVQNVLTHLDDVINDIRL